MHQAKSLYISHAVSNFYETGIEIWDEFGLVGSTEKMGQLKATIEGAWGGGVMFYRANKTKQNKLKTL